MSALLIPSACRVKAAYAGEACEQLVKRHRIEQTNYVYKSFWGKICSVGHSWIDIAWYFENYS